MSAASQTTETVNIQKLTFSKTAKLSKLQILILENLPTDDRAGLVEYLASQYKGKSKPIYDELTGITIDPYTDYVHYYCSINQTQLWRSLVSRSIRRLVTRGLVAKGYRSLNLTESGRAYLESRKPKEEYKK